MCVAKYIIYNNNIGSHGVDWIEYLKGASWIVIVVLVAAIYSTMELKITDDADENTSFTFFQYAFHFIGCLLSATIVTLVATLWINVELALGGLAGIFGYKGMAGFQELFDIGRDTLKGISSNFAKTFKGFGKKDDNSRNRYKDDDSDSPDFWDDTHDRR